MISAVVGRSVVFVTIAVVWVTVPVMAVISVMACTGIMPVVYANSGLLVLDADPR